MLKEISCSLFKESGSPRPPIRFHEGLNIVLGSENGDSGSIGKSTLLLIIDFVFGGSTYLKRNIVEQIGHHSIKFTFCFDGTDYNFSRSTRNPDQVVTRDGNGESIEVWEKTKFTEWLKSKYQMESFDVSFRQIISRFFRIYGKTNLEALRPLQMRSGTEKGEDAINILINLYGFAQSLKQFKNQLDAAESRLNAFREARKFSYVPAAVNGVTKYLENQETIAKLQKEQFEMKRQDETAFAPKELEEANIRDGLRRQLEDVQRYRKMKENDLHLLEINLHEGTYPTEADLSTLIDFFPDANIQKIHDIEKFHNKIQAILRKELQQQRAAIEEELVAIREHGEQLAKQIGEIKPSTLLSDEFLIAYTEIDRKIARLRQENDAFETHKNLVDEKSKATARYERQIADVLERIEHEINKQMMRIAKSVNEPGKNPPILHLKKRNSYQFGTPNDNGTNTNYRGLVIYDLAVLASTDLPAIAHDSLIFDSITRPDVSRILGKYAEFTNKQIFISLDKTNTLQYWAREIIKQRTIIKLDDNEKALFGTSWNRKK